MGTILPYPPVVDAMMSLVGPTPAGKRCTSVAEPLRWLWRLPVRFVDHACHTPLHRCQGFSTARKGCCVHRVVMLLPSPVENQIDRLVLVLR